MYASGPYDQEIRQAGVKVGVALNPATPLSAIEYVLDKVDMILIMTVNPGYGGQKYIPYCDRKIHELRTMIKERGLDVDIQVDGGVTPDNIASIAECGANVFVADLLYLSVILIKMWINY